MEDSKKETISSRIKELMESKEIKVYRIAKETGISEASFGRSLKTKDTWKLQHIEKIANYFKVPIDYLVTGNIDNVNEKLREENKKLVEDNKILKEKITTYETVAKSIIQKSSKKEKLNV